MWFTIEDGAGNAGWGEVTRPPTWLAVANIVVAAFALACHLPGSRMANWLGYGAGAWLVPVLAVLFYATDRRRGRSRTYVPEPLWNRIVNVSALAAIGIGFMHAFFVSQSSYYG